jgi:hypothetical protein
MVHLYALADHPARLPRLSGLDGSALTAADADGIDAIFSEHEAGSIGATEDAVLAHARVVEEVGALNDAVLPARFPGRYETKASLVDAVRGDAPQLRVALQRVRGCAEMGVRVVRRSDGGAPSAGSGSDYMRGRLDAVRDAERLAGELDAAVRGISRDGACSVVATSELVLSAAHLVARADVERFREAVETVARAHPELAYVCVGPWAPYSFALVDGRAR